MAFKKKHVPWNKGIKSKLCGEKHWHWNGGKQITGKGYVHLYRPEHPNADPRGRVYEHRVMMEEKLGRFLTKEEVVHHINGDKKDNRPENLELYSCSGEHLKNELTGRCNHWAIGNKNRLGKKFTQEAKNKISKSLLLYHSQLKWTT